MTEELVDPQNLRYKDFHQVCCQSVEQGSMQVNARQVREFDSMKSLAQELEVRNMLSWWEHAMGFKAPDS